MAKIILEEYELTELLAQIREIVKQELICFHQKDWEDRLVSPAEACKLFKPQISTQTLSRWSKDGRIPQYRIGGRIFYKQVEVINSAKSLKRYKHELLP